MNLSEKFQNRLKCICQDHVIFNAIDDVECDWGIHTLVQCPKCEELFSIDVKCHAFQSIIELSTYNDELFSQKEKTNYLSNSHPS